MVVLARWWPILLIALSVGCSEGRTSMVPATPLPQPVPLPALAEIPLVDPPLLLTPEAPLPGRSHHTVTRTGDGRLLVAGGLGLSGPLASAYLFDPTDGSTQRLPPLPGPRMAHSATRVAGPDGRLDTADDRVVLIGGFDGQRLLATVALFIPDESGGRFVDLGPILNVPLARHQAVVLTRAGQGAQDVLVVGGVTELGTEHMLMRGALLISVTGAGGADIHTLSPPGYCRVGHSLTLLPGADGRRGSADDQVLSYGGYGGDPHVPSSEGENLTLLGDGEVYDPTTDTWVRLAENAFYRNGRSADLDSPGPRREHSAIVLSNGTVLLVGGTQSTPGAADPVTPLVSTIEILTPDYRRRSQASIVPAGDLIQGRLAPQVSLLPDGRAIITGGMGADGSLVGLIEVYESGFEGGLSQLEPELACPRIHHAGHPILDGLWVLGGLDAAGLPISGAQLIDLTLP